MCSGFFFSIYQALVCGIKIIAVGNKSRQNPLLPLMWILFKIHCLLKCEIPFLFDFLVW